MAAEAILHQQQKRKLRTLAHSLKPVVTVGSAGLTTAVLNEIELSLSHHELLKIKLSCGDKVARTQVRTQICSEMGAHLIQEIGGMIVIFRKAKSTIKQAKPKKKTLNKRSSSKAYSTNSKPGRKAHTS